MPELLEQHPLRAVHGRPDRLRAQLGLPGAVRPGHFRLLSGRHSDTFIAFSAIANDRQSLQEITDWLIPSVAPWEPTAIVAPTTAGVSIASVMASRLAVPLHLADVDEAGRAVGLVGAADLTGQRTAIVNDVVTTGQGLDALRAVAEGSGATVVGAAFYLSRSDTDLSQELGLPVASVGTIELPSWQADACRLCQAQVELEDGLDLN